MWYNERNFIGQFATILSVNKTMDFTVSMGANCAHFLFKEQLMNRKVRRLVYGAILAALYVTLTHLQNLLLPGSATWAIQFRVSEALCVFSLFTPAAPIGLTIGCALFNLTYAGALPLDFLIGSAATLFACGSMYFLRKVRIKGYPLAAMLMSAVWNAVLVGWELSVYIGGGFWLNALYVAIGEAAVLLSLGTFLYYAIKLRRLDTRLFSE